MRRRILLLTLGTTTLVVLAFVIPLVILIGNNARQDASTSLQSQAQFTAFYARSSVDAADLQTYVDSADDRNDTRTQVQRSDGSTVGDVPAEVLAAVDAMGFPSSAPGSGGSGSSDGSGTSRGSGSSGGSGGGAGYPDDGGVPGGPGGVLRSVADGKYAVGYNRDSGARVLVYATDGSLSRVANERFAIVAGAGALLLLLSAAAAVFVSRRISAPLTETASAAHRLSAGDIDARAPTTGPREVAEVGTALNRLAGRIDELIGEERETVADLSHRMRTPLTALRLDADTLADPAESERIGAHVASLERTLTAVIRSARRAEREGLVPSCDATAVVADRTAFWSALAEDQGRGVEVILPPRAVAVRAAAPDLAAAVDALVENVLAHTPEGTDFRVELAATLTGAQLVVADRGPGIPPGAGVRGRSDRGSTGLGLSIAARCAEGSGGTFAVERPAGGGGLVRLVLGAP